MDKIEIRERAKAKVEAKLMGLAINRKEFLTMTPGSVSKEDINKCLEHFDREKQVWEYLGSLIGYDNVSPNNIDNK